MIRRILVPVDGSEHAARAIDLAADIALKYGCPRDLLHVQTELGSARIPRALESYVQLEHAEMSEAELLRQAGAELLAQAKARARKAGVQAVGTVLVAGDAAAGIAEHARANDVDLIVMGRRGLGGLGGLLLGSVSHKVAQSAPCACMTVK